LGKPFLEEVRMAGLTLSEEVVPVDVEVHIPLREEGELAATQLSSTTAFELRALNAPADLVKDVAVAAVAPETDAAGLTAERAAEFFERFRRHEGELVSSETVYRRVRVLACAAPRAADAKVTTTLELSASGGGGLNLTLGGFGLKGEVKYTLTQDLELETAAGEAKIGYILVPLTREVRKWRPPGAEEEFEVERFIPIKDASRLGSLATKADVKELLDAAVGESTPLGGGDASFSDTRSRKTEMSWSVELGFGDKVNKIGLTASLEGSVEVTTAFSLPAGSFRLRWLRGPAGAVVTDARDQ
jgi:hypothetical protein